MSEKPSWIDYLNLTVTLATAAIGVIVAVKLGSSADRLNQESLSIASASFLLDDQPQRKTTGIRIVAWLSSQNIAVPDWESDLVREIAKKSDAHGPDSKFSADSEPLDGEAKSGGSGAPEPSGSPATTDAASLVVANQLFAAIAGTTPRLFIEYSTPDLQEDAAEKIRSIMNQVSLDGQSLVVPKLEHVAVAPNRIELRFFKPNDQDDAKLLAEKLTRIIGATVSINNRSETYKDRADVKARTFELWLPANQKINVSSDADR